MHLKVRAVSRMHFAQTPLTFLARLTRHIKGEGKVVREGSGGGKVEGKGIGEKGRGE